MSKSKECNGWKCFDKDLKCRDFQFEIGKEYTQDGKIELCRNGFHFHSKSSNLFEYYPFKNLTRVCEIIASGDIIHDDDKSVCGKIKIIKELTWNEILDICNSGLLS